MKPNEINKAIAGHLGWISKKVPSDEDVAKQGYDEFRHTWWYSPIGELASIPDFCSDLNVMHEAEKALNTLQKKDCLEYAVRACYRDDGPTASAFYANPAQRAEAFLRTVQKWKEAE